MLKFNYEEVIEKINKINIVRQGDEVVTYYGDREMSRKGVSGRYEIFDFKPFVISCIDEVINNYEIEEYSFSIVGGRQEIRFFSKPEVIEGESFRRSFYLINSSDKSKALSFSYGLRHNNFHYISEKGSIYKKHYRGITKYVDEKVDLDDTIFQEQLDIMRDLIGDSIYMSNVQRVITESEELNKSKVSLRSNFVRFKQNLYYNSKRNGLISQMDREKLFSPSWSFSKTKNVVNDFIKNPQEDFMVDSFFVFKTYLNMFSRRDSGFIKKESRRISEMSVLTNRNSMIDDLLNELD